MKCYIWGTLATDTPIDDYAGARLNSPRAGGIYRATGSVLGNLQKLNMQERKVVTSWLVEQRQLGNSEPEITSDNLPSLRQRRPMTFSAKIDSALRFFDRNTANIGEGVFFDFESKLSDTAMAFLPTCEMAAPGEAAAFAQSLEDMGLLKTHRRSGKSVGYMLSPSGRLKLEQIEHTNVDSSQAFVAMWFDVEMTEAWANGLEKAINEAGYRPLRIDKKEHINKVDDEIIAEIRRSRFVVADFTCASGQPRGGVYFEAGFAMGLNIPVIWTAKCTTIENGDLHFDTRQYNHISWTDPADLYTQLKNRIEAVIGEGPLKERDNQPLTPRP